MKVESASALPVLHLIRVPAFGRPEPGVTGFVRVLRVDWERVNSLRPLDSIKGLRRPQMTDDDGRTV